MSEEKNVNDLERKEEKKKRLDCFVIAKNLSKLYRFLTFSDTSRVFVYDEGVYKETGEEFIMKLLEKELGHKLTTYYVNEIINHIKRMSLINRGKIIEASTNLLCLENGILDMDKLIMMSHNPDLVFFNKLPVVYNHQVDCKKFKKFLFEVCSLVDAKKIQHYIGYCLIRRNLYQKALMLYGPGGGGKSTFLETMRRFFGIENCKSILLQDIEENRFTRIELFGKLANIAPDIPAKALHTSSRFKAIVAGDGISGEKKGKDPFEFIPYCKLMFSANQIPETMDFSEAFFRRWILAEFPQNFEDSAECIPNLRDDFITSNEMSGILNWALEGKKEVDMFQFADVLDTKIKWLRSSNSVYGFCQDILMEGSKEEWIVREELFKKYLRYCKSWGLKGVSENLFYRRIRNNYEIEVFHPSVGEEEKKQVEAWKGIKWKRNI